MPDARDAEEPHATAAAGDNLPCSRCGAPVEPSDRLCMVVVRGLPYGFHASCYAAWRT